MENIGLKAIQNLHELISVVLNGTDRTSQENIGLKICPVSQDNQAGFTKGLQKKIDEDHAVPY